MDHYNHGRSKDQETITVSYTATAAATSTVLLQLLSPVRTIDNGA
jgi:hypothetical protein